MLGSPAALKFLIRNLLDNAIRYNDPSGSVQLRITKEVDAVVLSISDNGPGIEESQRHRVFDRFYRGENTSDVDGTGLGLSIAKRVAVLHGAEIQLGAQPKGPGLVVTVRFRPPSTAHDSLQQTV